MEWRKAQGIRRKVIEKFEISNLKFEIFNLMPCAGLITYKFSELKRF